MADELVNAHHRGHGRSRVPKGTSIIEAAKQAGVLVPHYCYHPALPVAGVCRMCLVEVEKAPKLAPACATAVAEGQVVHVNSDKRSEGAQGRARVAAHQPSARLPDLRSGRRVRAAGLRLRPCCKGAGAPRRGCRRDAVRSPGSSVPLSWRRRSSPSSTAYSVSEAFGRRCDVDDTFSQARLFYAELRGAGAVRGRGRADSRRAPGADPLPLAGAERGPPVGVLPFMRRIARDPEVMGQYAMTRWTGS